MIPDAVRVARLIGAIWFGDLTRSVTGSRTRSKVALILSAVLVVAWLAFAVATARTGTVGISERLQLQLLGELISGTALAAGCAVSMLLVLTPSGQELEGLLCTVPIRRGSALLGRTAAPMLLGAAVAPVVMAPVLVSSIQLAGAAALGPIVAGAGTGALAGAVVITLLIRGLEVVVQRLGLPQAVVTSLAAGAALGTSALVYAKWSRAEWIFAFPGGFGIRAWTAVGIAAALTVVGGLAVVNVVRLASSAPIAPLVRWLRSGWFRPGAPLSIDLLQTGRNPLFVSTIAMMGLAATAAVVATPSQSAAWSSVMLLLIVAAPASTMLVLYGTNRRALWLRSSTMAPGRSRYGAIKLVVAAVVAAIASILVLGFGSVLEHLDATPWHVAVPVGLLAAAASLLAGVHVPADLEMPGAPIVAVLEAAVLTAVPYSVATTLPEPAPTVIACGLVIVYSALVPVSVHVRRQRNITA